MTTATVAVLAQAMTEAELQTKILRMCRDLGLRAWHCHIPQGSRKGLPDLIIVGPGGVLWRELKSEKGRVSDAQTDWLTDLTSAGQDAAVWRPMDLVTGVVARELAALAGVAS